MVGPEPHQPLDKSNLGAESSLGADPRLLEIDLPSRIGHAFGGHLQVIAESDCLQRYHRQGAAQVFRTTSVILIVTALYAMMKFQREKTYLPKAISGRNGWLFAS